LQLEGNGITVFLADAETVNMDWLLGNAIGNIKLQVRPNRPIKPSLFWTKCGRKRASAVSRGGRR